MPQTMRGAGLTMVLAGLLLVASAGGGIVVDRECVELAAIPESYLPPAAQIRVLMRHASVGQGIDWGLACLAGAHPTNVACSGFPAGKYDRSKWVFELRAGNWRAKVDDLTQQAAARAGNFDVLMMKFCYIDALGTGHPDWEYYRGQMEQLEKTYPGNAFVWWTIPLTRDGQPGTDVFNAQVRSYCAAHGKILFDIADMECHEPNGVKLVNAAGHEVISARYTKEIHAGHLNPEGRVRVASALWHLMARLAGWDPGPFQLTPGKGAQWSSQHAGYDPNLPGYHLAGDIASVALKATADTLPEKLILTIQTSSSTAPMLENFTLAGPLVKLVTEPFNPRVGLEYYQRADESQPWVLVPDIQTDSYFRFEIAEGVVRVTFLPPAIELLRVKCIASWIDRYR